jgi:two-component system, LuxR family, sensor kinase FixL
MNVRSRIDVLLHASRRSLPRDQLRRTRLLAGITAVLVPISICNLPILLFQLRAPLWHVVLAMVIGCSLASAMAILRFRMGSLLLPSLLTLMPLFLLYAFYSMTHGLSQLAAAPGHVTLLILVGYLLGRRAGLVAAGMVIVEVLTSAIVDQMGWSPALHLSPHALDPINRAVFDVTGVAALGMLGWLYEVSREEAQRALASSEANLLALVENTDDSICYLDREGRIVAMNNSLKSRYLSCTGREPSVGQLLFEGSSSADRARWAERFQRALAGERVVAEEHYALPERSITVEFSLRRIRTADGTVGGLTLFGRDVTARVESAESLKKLHHQMVDLSRQAGMSEVATGILHNVGNALNNVTVSAQLLAQTLRQSKVPALEKAVHLMEQHQADLPEFLRADPRGSRLPKFLVGVASSLRGEQGSLLTEVDKLCQQIDHIGSIISVQQENALPGGVVEIVSASEVLDDALRLHELLFRRLAMEVHRDYRELAPLAVDRHKLLQILVNIIRNACDSITEAAPARPRLDVRLSVAGNLVRISITDNGGGVAPENAQQLFRQGFTTKATGHGFGLHMSAIMAADLGGSLGFDSAGKGQGAAFTLEIPLRSALAA